MFDHLSGLRIELDLVEDDQALAFVKFLPGMELEPHEEVIQVPGEVLEQIRYGFVSYGEIDEDIGPVFLLAELFGYGGLTYPAGTFY